MRSSLSNRSEVAGNGTSCTLGPRDHGGAGAGLDAAKLGIEGGHLKSGSGTRREEPLGRARSLDAMSELPRRALAGSKLRAN